MQNPDSVFIQNYMNGLDKELFNGVVQKNFIRTWRYIASTSYPLRKKHYCYRAVAAFRSNPKPFYSLEQKSLSRILTRSPLVRIAPAIKKVLLEGFQEVDLKSTQLAICARLWDVRPLISFLESGESIWDHLNVVLDVPPTQAERAKFYIKRAVYATCFGKDREKIKASLTAQLNRLNVIDAGDKFVDDEYIGQLHEASQDFIARITAEKGAFNYNGEWEELGDKKPEALTAQIAQAHEVRLILSAFQYATKQKDFKIMLYQYDGISVQFLRNEEKHRAGITKAITDNLKTLGVPTTPQWK